MGKLSKKQKAIAENWIQPNLLLEEAVSLIAEFASPKFKVD